MAEPCEQARLASAELQTLVTALRLPALERLVTIGRALLDERRLLAPDEQARLARVELETIAASLPVDQLERLVRLGREVLKETPTGARALG